jgi:hypothetical protein
MLVANSGENDAFGQALAIAEPAQIVLALRLFPFATDILESRGGCGAVMARCFIPTARPARTDYHQNLYSAGISGAIANGKEFAERCSPNSIVSTIDPKIFYIF